MTPPPLHWRSYGTDPLPTGKEVLNEPFSAFLSGSCGSPATGAARIG
jgi:hypothetical protein